MPAALLFFLPILVGLMAKLTFFPATHSPIRLLLAPQVSLSLSLGKRKTRKGNTHSCSLPFLAGQPSPQLSLSLSLSLSRGPNVSASSSSSPPYPPAGRTAAGRRRRRLVNFSPLQSAPALTLLLLKPMETSLRLRGGGGLRIHAKEKLPLGYNSLLQAHAEIHAGAAAPSYLALFVRHFYPQLAANVGVGVQLHKGDDLTYNLRAKKALPFTSNGLLGLNLKGRLLTDTEFKPRKRTGAVELAWTILDFRKGQDVRLKLGYELYDKVPYLQLRENNWTLNAYMDGKWDVRFDM